MVKPLTPHVSNVIRHAGWVDRDCKHAAYAALDSSIQSKCGLAAKNMDANFDEMGNTVFGGICLGTSFCLTELRMHRTGIESAYQARSRQHLCPTMPRITADE